MIEDIYKNIVYSSEYMQEKAKEVDEYIDGYQVAYSVLTNIDDLVNNNEYEKKRDLLFGVANKAEEVGFIVGFKYGVELILESLENLHS